MKEANIIWQPGIGTIVPNMAGFGINIKLSSESKVTGVLPCSEESKVEQIDSGRQGDPGSSKFFVSLA